MTVRRWDDPAVHTLAPTRASRIDLRGLDISPALHACSWCRYWLHRREDFCPNCGGRSTHRDAPWKRPITRRWRKVGAAAGGVLGLGWLALGAPAALTLLVVAPATALAGLLAGHHKARASVDATARRDRSRDCLNTTEDRLRAVLREIDGTIRELIATRATVTRGVTGAKRAAALDNLERKHAARVLQRHRCMTALWSVEFVRWWNLLYPVLEDLDRASRRECERRFAAVERILALGEEMVIEWRTEPTADSAPGKAFLTRCEQALASLLAIREEIALRQAALTDPDGTLDLPSQDLSLRRELARFQEVAASIAGGAFAHGTQAIEDETHRLDGLDEVRRLLAESPDDGWP